MSSPIEVRNIYSERVGTIDFGSNSNALSIHRTASGFKIGLSYKLSIVTVSKASAMPVISNIRGSIFMNGSAGRTIEVGQFRDEAFYQSYRDENPRADYQAQGYANWYCSFEEMALIEKSREGKEPKFQVELWLELSHLLPTKHPRHDLKTESEKICGRTELIYSKEIWIQRLRSVNALENILVEIPLPASPPLSWDEVWGALAEARSAFEQGGATGWKGAANAVRLALEKWQKIEKEDMGAGWQAPSSNDRAARTKEQRLDNLRWHLLQLAHLGPHSSADEWDRDEALLLLATLAALLAKRKP